MKLVNDIQGVLDEDELEMKIDALSDEAIKFIENEIRILPQSPLKYNSEFELLAEIKIYKKEIRKTEKVLLNEFDNPILHTRIEMKRHARQKQIHKLWKEYERLLYDNYSELKERAMQIKSAEIQNLYQQIISDEQTLAELKSEDKELKKLKQQCQDKKILKKQIRENRLKQVPVKQKLRLNIISMTDIIGEHELHPNFCEECFNVHCIKQEHAVFY